ncbi:MAG: hypothetical protein PF637_05275 [Spirochaetes bacterium]|jgi:DNA-directed RNA polymerase subunit RPC12/RpoP|nr:hypothetical protein [Spirochaetota bacterium]
MNVTCNKCGKMHSLPDKAASNNKIYFFCSKCSHKIIVDTRSGSTEQLKYYSTVDYTALFNGLFTFFNWPSLLLTALFMTGSLILAVIAGIIVSRNSTTFMTNPGLATVLGIFFFMLLFFLRNLNLYFTTKISAYRNAHPHKIGLNWKEINFDFGEDWLTLFICSIVPVLLLAIAVVPVSLFNFYGVLYTGLLFPIIFILSLITIPLLFSNRLWTAIIGTGSFFVRDGLAELLRFAKKEYVEIPFYVIIITAISKFFIFLFTSIFLAVLSVSVILPVVFISPEVKGFLLSAGSSQAAALPDHVGLGLVILFAVVALIVILFVSFCDNFIQALYVRAVQIMRLNPEESFSRPVMLVIMVLISVFIIMGIIAAATVFSTLPFPFLK